MLRATPIGPNLGAALRGACITAAALAAAAPSRAFEWSYTPAVSVGAGHDTNIRLEPVDPRAVASSQLTAEAAVVGRDEGFDFRLAPRITALRYDDELEADRNDGRAELEIATYDDRQRWSLGGALVHEGTLTSEFESTGFVAADIDRDQSSLNTSWARSGARGRYDVAASAISVDYEEVPFSPFADYDYRVVHGGYTLATSERSSWRFSVAHMELSGEGTGLKTVSADARAVWSHQFSAALNAHFGVGIFDVSAEGPLGTDSSGPSAELGVARAWERWSLDASAGRDLRPDGRGALVREDSVRLGAVRQITQKLKVGAAVLAAKVVSAGNITGFYDRDYAQGGLTVQWRFARRWALDAAFYERAQRSPVLASASGSIGQFAVSYRGLD